MRQVHVPRDEHDVARIAADAAASRTRIEIVGGATRRGFGHEVEADAVLETGHISGISLYEPAALTLVVRAGTPLAEIDAALGEQGQHLPFEPPRLTALLGTDGKPTIGGTIACGLSGPRRIQAGAARDSLIGVRFVTGSGDRIKNGGRVMKNVTGYDLVKLLCGSHGTLGVLTEVSLKVLPRPLSCATLLLRGLDETAAQQAMTAARVSPFDVSGAAHVPHGEDDGPLTMVRIEGFARSVDYRVGQLAKLLAQFGEAETETGQDSENRWQRVREAEPLVDRGGAIWRLSVMPSLGPQIVRTVERSLAVERLYDWGGGLIWLATEETGDCGAAVIRGAIARGGGHATLMRAGAPVRRQVPVFHPQEPAVAAISSRLRDQFDPHGVFNPGRMGPLPVSRAA